MKKLKGKTQIKGGHFHDGKGKQFTVLQDALANDTKCGCGINCKDGFVSLPNFNSESGDKEGFYGFYIADGELVTDTVANIKQEINSFCGGGDGGSTPQALRLTFDSIENANLLVGDASNVADWNTFFDLPTNGNPYTSVTISGNTVILTGGSNVILTNGNSYENGLFANNEHLIEVYDEGTVVGFGDGVFYQCTELLSAEFLGVTNIGDTSDYIFGTDYVPMKLAYISFPNLISAGEYVFGYVSYYNGSVDCTFNLPLLQYAGDSCFDSCTYVTNINLPSLTTAGISCFFSCTSLTTINIPSCTDLGGTVGDDNVFFNISGNTITLTIPSALMTANSGNPDGDIAYLQANNTVTVNTV